MPSTMKRKERWSVLDGDLLRRRRSARAVIDHYLDRLVDIFDFPLTPTPVSSLPVPSPTSRKWSASTDRDTYTTMDGICSPRSSNNKTRKVSMGDRLREFWISSTCTRSSKTLARRSMTICNNSVASSYPAASKVLRVSRSSTPLKADPWFDEKDRVLECGYQCLVDEATI